MGTSVWQSWHQLALMKAGVMMCSGTVPMFPSLARAVVGHMDHLAHFSCFSQLFDVLVVSTDQTLGMLHRLEPQHLYLKKKI